jgi:hypothetical protein
MKVRKGKTRTRIGANKPPFILNKRLIMSYFLLLLNRKRVPETKPILFANSQIRNAKPSFILRAKEIDFTEFFRVTNNA